MTVAFTRRDALNEPLDLAGIGIGPSNLSLACLLESVPEVAAKLKEPESKERKFEDVVKSAEQAAVLVLVY